MSSHTDESQKQAAQDRGDQDPIWEAYKCLLLLGIMVATVTCTAGLDPPGGLWQESKDGHLTGDPIMHGTRRVRYTVFCIFNSSAFVVSLVLVVYLLLLSAMKERVRRKLVFLRIVVVVELILLITAFLVGSCRGHLITIYASVHCGVIVIVAIILVVFSNMQTKNDVVEVLSIESRKVLMLLAIFATAATYTASLTPPGGFWEHAPAAAGKAKHHRAGDPILLEQDLGRLVVFFVGNTTAFIMSVVIMILLLFVKLTKKNFMPFCACFILVMVGLATAYIAGVPRHLTTDTIVIIITCLVGDMLLHYIFHVDGTASKDGASGDQVAGVEQLPEESTAADRTGAREGITGMASKDGASGGQVAGVAQLTEESSAADGTGAREGITGTESKDGEDDARDLILLLATMVATVTYQAGLQPPGGVWRGAGDGHTSGGLILLVTHAARYKAFFFFNTSAFVTSIVIVIMVQRRSLVSKHALEAAVILDMLGVMGAYAAGTIRAHQTWSSACVFTLAAAVIIFVFLVASLVHQKLQAPQVVKQDRSKEKRREVLMLLATMAITITYQAGLTPPGKFWLEHRDGEHHAAGEPVLIDTNPQRYKWFFFSNTVTFLTSVAIILFIVSRKLHSIGKTWWRVLFAYTLLVQALLMITFTAGANRRLHKATTFAGIVATTLPLLLHVGSSLIAMWNRGNDFTFDKSEWWIQNKNGGDHPGASRACLDGDLPGSSPARQRSQLQASDEMLPAPGSSGQAQSKQASSHRYREYLMGVSILAASVAYQAGLSPPGGIWPDNGRGHAAAGNPVLYDTDRRRYLAFHYCNTASFAASIAVNVLLLLDVLGPTRFALSAPRATDMVLVLDVLSLLMAYAIGSSRDKGTWMYVLAMATAMLAYIAIYKMVLPQKEDPPQRLPQKADPPLQGEQRRSKQPV